ncbi:hypothetical protein [Ktedonospora formicarum]|uniref:Uncharacterized protein n=1 Tax=Ktedonospora formicarum TaxID=2778364 RepID=A0A8J3I095_9CHLR|nr:hypothetical protein [Ktedonospora formicarum]GHO46431.1 hypothetical protein KSX_45940 [Ktedonospora formicarum]
MSLALRKNQMLALVILAFLTLVVIGLVTYTTIAHVDVWHMFSASDIKPNMIYPHG